MICIYTIGNIERDPLLYPLAVEILEMWRFESLFLQIWRVGYRVNAELWNVKVEGWPSWELDKIKEKMPQWAKIKRINDGLSVPEKKSPIQFWCFWNSCQFFIQNWIWFFVFFLHKFCDHIYLERSLNSSNAQIWKKSWFPILCLTFFLTMRSFFWYTIFGGRHFFLFFLKGKRGLFFGKSAHI